MLSNCNLKKTKQSEGDCWKKETRSVVNGFNFFLYPQAKTQSTICGCQHFIPFRFHIKYIKLEQILKRKKNYLINDVPLLSCKKSYVRLLCIQDDSTVTCKSKICFKTGTKTNNLLIIEWNSILINDNY